MLQLFAHRLGRFAGSERGTQLVELAIVLPVLLALFAATAEFGRYFHSYSTLAKSTRAGARYLSTTPVKSGGSNPCKDDDVRRLVVYGDPQAADGSRPVLPGLTLSNVELKREGVSTGVPEKVTVRIVNYNYKPLINLGSFANNLKWANPPLKPSTTMRYLLTQPSPPGSCS
jgi:hypothetical protein